MTDETSGATEAAPPVPPDRQPGDPQEDPTQEDVTDAKDADAEAEEDRVDAAPREAP